jgi:tetratricopeptide (TPR) repeat protein
VAQKSKAQAAEDYARFRWGELAFRDERFAQASDRLAPFLFAHDDSPYRPSALLLLGDARVHNREYLKAEGAYERFLKRYPEHRGRVRAQLGVSLCLFESGKLKEAEEKLQAIRGDIKDEDLQARVKLLRARCLAGTDRPKEAVAQLVELFKRREPLPDAEQVYLEGVQAALAAGDEEHAIAWVGKLEELAAKAPQTAQARLQLARWLADKGRFADALPYCRRIFSIEKAPERPQALYLTGFCAMKLRKFDDAVQAYQSLLADHPKFDQAAAARFSLGLAHESLGAKTKAVEVYQLFLKEHPGDALGPRVKQRLEALQPQP